MRKQFEFQFEIMLNVSAIEERGERVAEGGGGGRGIDICPHTVECPLDSSYI